MSPLLPSFFIIGERKCGTSALYRYLLEHPLVVPGARKEMQLFTKSRAELAAGFADYLSRFPSSGKSSDNRDTDDTAALCWPELDAEGNLYEETLRFFKPVDVALVAGEASADTFADGCPALLHEYLPALQLVLILRDPVARAFSHHRMLRRFQDEGRELPMTIGTFAEDMETELGCARKGEASALLRASSQLSRRS